MVQRVAILLALFFVSVPAVAASAFSGEVDQRTKSAQDQAERLFATGERLDSNGEHDEARDAYERAFLIYRNDLSPIGDKYAQYMVGYMYYFGTGVEQDQVLASAWYRLAAENSYPELIAVRDQALRAMTDVDRLRSDKLFLELRREYSDAVLLLDLIRDDIAELRGITGSRAGGAGSTVTVFDLRTGIGKSGDAVNREIRRRVQARLKRIDELVPLRDFDRDPDRLDLDALDGIVRTFVETINDR